MTLSKVFFPAPFGPIRPKSPPSSTSKLTSFSAARPAKFLLMRSSLRMGATAAPRTRESNNLAEQSHYAARFKQDNQNQERTIQQQVELRERCDQLLMDEAVNKRTDDRAPDGPNASDNGHQQDRDADVEPEDALRINKCGVTCVDSAGRSRQRGGKRVGAKRIYAEIGCRVFIFADSN